MLKKSIEKRKNPKNHPVCNIMHTVSNITTYVAMGGQRREGQKTTRELVQNEFLKLSERCCQSAYDESVRKLL